MILYAFSLESEAGEDRWAEAGIRELFYTELDEVREAVRDVRADLAQQKDGASMGPIRIERVERDDPTPESVLTLLNSGIGPLVRHYEIVETIA
jgi:hypothetical protein